MDKKTALGHRVSNKDPQIPQTGKDLLCWLPDSPTSQPIRRRTIENRLKLDSKCCGYPLGEPVCHQGEGCQSLRVFHHHWIVGGYRISIHHDIAWETENVPDQNVFAMGHGTGRPFDVMSFDQDRCH